MSADSSVIITQIIMPDIQKTFFAFFLLWYKNHKQSLIQSRLHIGRILRDTLYFNNKSNQ